ncbi:hypothetical protein GGH91_001449 [Coemansia sp. RSA 2671]|uniref:Uncharacterized protein n=1 Tax=Coemansia linderi TaxID=2663919 RepID=A0ACC1K3A7_9FUNG|nr:hypothetical protein LPJ60_002253 [Coemansia sp. RSA 2675]KAJ2348293.1 hypothetical protein GGH91_001449 [Coemansia sp. RSA 2671]KAJ2369428.1 hypothetical protein H4S02_009939 [Coemansia sp. RSA 2611]KAJ2411566.1 hypothetical protein GGI10_004190 [Coemansia sp. RSA 2530]KAJ2772388.1 hypothetical protein GGI18_004880 [Coemansia linderi]
MTDTAITRKTRFVDLPANLQQLLVEIEQQKQVQLQIGSSIVAEDTEHSLQRVSRSVQRLAQDLQLVKMTLNSDRHRVDEVQGLVSFAVKHADKGRALVNRATDAESWELSGLTPHQVTNRQKALLALQRHVDNKLEAAEAAAPAAADGAVDAYEAVRRIQFASMNHNVAGEYYWAWLTQAESSVQMLTERLDQLERFVAATGEETQTKVSPRAVSDVMQYQNDSFLAIAGKVAALDDDVRRLAKRLGIKESN